MSRVKTYLGDCLDILPTIPSSSIDLILCDLPYGTTNCDWDKIISLDELWKQYNRIIKDKHPIVLFGSEPFSSYLRMSNIKKYKYDWVWNKKLAGNGILAKKQPLKVHENICVFNSTIYYPQKIKGKMRKKMTGEIKTNNCELFCDSKTIQKEYVNDEYYPISIQEFSVAGIRKNRLHPTQKPVPLLEYLIKTYTQEGDTILDNCMGSGSTGVASIITKRNFIGIEKEQKYYDIASKRLAKTLDNS